MPILARIRARWRAMKIMRFLRNICEQVANELRGVAKELRKASHPAGSDVPALDLSGWDSHAPESKKGPCVGIFKSNIYIYIYIYIYPNIYIHICI